MMILFIAACEDDSSIESDVDLTTYLDTVELPKNLAITFDPANVESPFAAKIYREVSHLAFDVELAKDKLLTSEVIEFEQQAVRSEERRVGKERRDGCWTGVV